MLSDFSEEGKSGPIFFFDGSVEASNYIRKPPERILKKSLTVFLKIKRFNTHHLLNFSSLKCADDSGAFTSIGHAGPCVGV